MSTFITAKAEPTKEFFVDMITRDIPVDRAILDLIDNSVDGARRVANQEDYTSLYVELNISKDTFIIEDNCGGIPKEIATKQAFVFGKPKEYQGEKHSIGRFGIGMKRALFKIGKHFNVISHTEDFSFSLDENTENWVSKTIWDFQLEEIERAENQGTKIIINDVHEGISKDFALQYFTDALIREISQTHALIIQKGFTIIVNGEKVLYDNFLIKNSNTLKPEVINFPYLIEEKQVDIKIYVGVSERNLNKGGWYVFCNDRLILNADKCDITGWKYDDIPKYHPDFAFFRGYVTFDSDNANLLPWTTTKTGLNSDSEIYKIAFFEMKKIMKKVIAFLRARAEEDSKYNKEEIDGNPITQLINETQNVDFLSLFSQESKFTYTFVQPNQLEISPSPGRIQYSKEHNEIEFLKKYIGVKTNKDVGKYTFEYFLDLARSENE